MGGTRGLRAAHALGALLAVVVAVAVGSGLAPDAAAGSMPAAERQTLGRITRVLASLPVYPGARRAHAAGFPLTGPAGIVGLGSPYRLTVHGLWYARAGVIALNDWADALAARLRMTEVGGTGKDGVRMGVLMTPSADPQSLWVSIGWQPVGKGRMAIRYDVTAMWQPPHPPAEIVPADVTAARVRLRVSPTAPVRSYTLKGMAAGRLATLVNALPVDTRGAHGCPGEVAGPAAHVTVRFVWPTGSLTAREGADSCAGVAVATGTGRPLPALFDPGERIMAAARADAR